MVLRRRRWVFALGPFSCRRRRAAATLGGEVRDGAAAGKESAPLRQPPASRLGRSQDRQVLSLAADQSQVSDQLLKEERRLAQAAGVLPGAALPGRAVACSRHAGGRAPGGECTAWRRLRPLRLRSKGLISRQVAQMLWSRNMVFSVCLIYLMYAVRI